MLASYYWSWSASCSSLSSCDDILAIVVLSHDQLVFVSGAWRLSWLFFCRYSPSLRPEDLMPGVPNSRSEGERTIRIKWSDPPCGYTTLICPFGNFAWSKDRAIRLSGALKAGYAATLSVGFPDFSLLSSGPDGDELKKGWVTSAGVADSD